MEEIFIFNNKNTNKEYMCKEIYDDEIEKIGNKIVNNFFSSNLKEFVDCCEEEVKCEKILKDLISYYIEYMNRNKDKFIFDFNHKNKDYFCSLKEIKSPKFIENEEQVGIEYLLSIDVYEVLGDFKNMKKVG